MPAHGLYQLLLVEDNPGDAFLTRERLDDISGFPYELKHATNLRDALTALRVTAFDATILDLGLPDSTGLDTLRSLRVHQNAGSLVVLSGAHDERLRQRALQEGAQEYLTKNEPAARLLVRCILTALERYRAQQQHQQLQWLVASNPDAVIVAATTGGVRYVNDAALKLFGRPRADFEQELIGFSTPPEGTTEIEILRGGERLIGEMRASHFNWLGEPVMLATIRDVTAQRRAKADLEEQRHMLQAILDSIGDGVVVADEGGRLVELNPAAKRIFGCWDGGPDCRPVWSDLHLYRGDGVTPLPTSETPLAKALRGESVDDSELVVSHPDVTPIWLSATARPLRNGSKAAHGGVVVLRDVTERRRITSERDQLLERLRTQIERMPLAYLLSDSEWHYTAWNPAAERMFGFSEAEVLGRHPFDVIVPEKSRAAAGETFERLRSGDMNAHGVCENVTKAGRPITCEWSNTPLLDRDGRFVGVMSLAQDVTERLRLEEGLRHASKMDAIGQLAGGIAHDFNNLLTVISGYSEIVIHELPQGHPVCDLIKEIRAASDRSAALTRQLLTFSRRQIIAPQTLSTNALIRDAGKMFQRIIGEDIKLEFALAAKNDLVLVDPGQLEQVLMNLAVNARDAMPTGGDLTIGTVNAELSAEDVKLRPSLRPGAYVHIRVSDTGCGISEEVKGRLFEPFFTTKGVGKGTGLGLAVVHGVVKQANGHVEVESEQGCGATFSVYLPCVESSVRANKPAPAACALPKGTETVLVVEDEEAVRILARRILTSCGYTVLDAGSGTKGLAAARSHSGPIHLLLSDVVMPDLSGRQLRDQFLAFRPHAKVIYMSGYTDDAIMRHGIEQERVQFLPKPFSHLTLASKVRTVLDGTA